MTEKGIPQKHRPLVWKFLIENKTGITKEYFFVLYKKVLTKFTKDQQIQKDIERTYWYFHGSQDFTHLLLEATVLLEMFQIYRPDIKYV